MFRKLQWFFLQEVYQLQESCRKILSLRLLQGTCKKCISKMQYASWYIHCIFLCVLQFWLPSVKTLETLDKNLRYSWISWYESWQDSYQEIHEFVRSCKIVPRNSRDELTKVNENKQKPTPIAAWSAYLLCRSFSRNQPSYHVLKFTTLCCVISNTSQKCSW